MALQSSMRQELLDIAQKYGTPTYVTDARVVRSRVNALQAGLGDSVTRMLYALKANALPDVVELVRDLGLGVDAVSPGEVLLAERLGIAAKDIFFSANNMTDGEMEFAVSRGVVVNIGEISRLAEYGIRHPGASVSIRVNTQHGAGHHSHVVTAGHDSKFGIPMDETEQVLAIAHRHRLRIVGVHQHIGSGNLTVDPYRRSLDALFDVAGRFVYLEFINVGGGLGVPYAPGEPEFDVEDLRRVIIESTEVYETSTGRSIDVWIEPGRYFVADAGVLLVEVNTIKTSYGHTYVGTNSGMNHLIRPAMYGAYHEVVNLSSEEGPLRAYDIVGNICESSDFFARDRVLPETGVGDVLAILGTGAYGSSMNSEYNLRPAPAEVFIDGEGTARLARQRESPEELVERILSRRLQGS